MRQFLMALFNARTSAHIMHLSTRSFARHSALNVFYDRIVELADDLAEAYQGNYGLIEWNGGTYSFKTDDPKALLAALREQAVKQRAEVSETNLQNIIDEILTLIDSTSYKLKFLQ